MAEKGRNMLEDYRMFYIFVSNYSAVVEIYRARGGVVVQVLCYKPAGRGFNSRWCHWNFLVT